MSGFAGIFCRDGATPDLAILDQMASRIAFRGPDAKQISVCPGAGVAFTLLRTGPAPQAETQPVLLDGRWWLAGDVRLDGRAELERKLQVAAAFKKGAADEELALMA